MKNVIIHLCFTVCFLILQVAVYGQPLDSLMKLAVENNPELKAVQLEYEAALEKQNQVSQLPNPEVGVGVPILRPETRLGPQMVTVGANQMFPWFGTLDAKKQVVISMSKVKYEELSAIKLDLYYKLQKAYYELIFLNQKKSVLAESLKKYESTEKVTLAKVEAGQRSLADVLRIQTKIVQIKSDLLQLENNKITLKATVNQLINAPHDNNIQPVDSLNYELMNYDLAAFRESIVSHHPLIKQMNYELETSKNRLEVNQNLNKPIIGVGVDYTVVAPRTDANPAFNGRDILVPKVKMSIPIYRQSYKAVVNEETLKQQAIEHQKENLTDLMLNRIIAYKVNYDNALLNRDLALQQVEKIHSAYRILVAQYSTASTSFEDLLSTQNELILLRLKVYQSQLEMGLAKANIDRLTNF